LRLHSLCYRLAGAFGITLNDGIHPKHRILRYDQWFLRHIEPNWNVLDIGSHTGILAHALAKKAAFVCAVEKEEHLVAVARERRGEANIEYVCADATNFDYKVSGPMHCITMSNVLEHIEHRVEFLSKIISQIRWADEKNRVLLFRVPMLERDWTVVFKKELGVEYRLDPTHHVEYTVEQFRDELHSAGIAVRSIEMRFGEIYAVCNVV